MNRLAGFENRKAKEQGRVASDKKQAKSNGGKAGRAVFENRKSPNHPIIQSPDHSITR
jgi:hypothetical protein